MPERATFSNARDYNAATVEEFRANGGEVTGDFAGRQLLLLTTTGAKSGKDRVTPLIYTKEAGAFIVTAADAGSDRHPGWYHNILADPKVTIEVGHEAIFAVASEPVGQDRDRLYANRIAETPRFLEYQSRTSRQIPIIVIRPNDL